MLNEVSFECKSMADIVSVLYKLKRGTEQSAGF